MEFFYSLNLLTKVIIYFGLFLEAVGVLVLLSQIRKIGCTGQARGKISVERITFMGVEGPVLMLAYTVNGVKYDKRVQEDTARPGQKRASNSLTYEGVDVEQSGGIAVNVFYNPTNPKLHYISDKRSKTWKTGVGIIIFGAVFLLLMLGIPWIRTQDYEMQDIAGKAFWFIIGLVFTSIGVLHWRRENKLRRECTAKVVGVVSEVQHNRTRKGRNYYTPVFKYSIEGVQYVRKSNHSTRIPTKFTVGDSVAVFYDRSNKERYYVLEDGRSIIANTAFIVVGLVIMIIAPFLEMS